MDKSQVVLGFSGGIDSVAAVNLLKNKGLKVTALTLDMCSNTSLIAKAKETAENIGVAFDSLNCTKLFEQEIKAYFIREYHQGRTPAPCTRCNPLIKWRLLLDYANRHNIYYIATGHYFRVVEYNSLLYVARPADAKKDQSYYLWGLTQEVLKRIATPMADIIKEDIKRESVNKRESMGVCFLNGRPYSEFVGETPAGNIVDKTGAIVGKHNGISNYTIGQKRGEGIPVASSIIGIDKSSNCLIIGNNDDLLHTQLFIDDCNIIDESELMSSTDITVLVRGLGRNPEGFAKRIIATDNGGYHITLSSPAWACAPGQPVVMYRDKRVIGGGYLTSSSK